MATDPRSGLQDLAKPLTRIPTAASENRPARVRAAQDASAMPGADRVDAAGARYEASKGPA